MMAHQWGDDVVEEGGVVLAISRLSFKECYGVTYAEGIVYGAERKKKQMNVDLEDSPLPPDFFFLYGLTLG